MLDSPAADVRRAHGVVESVGAALDPETTGLVPRWKILVPLAHARRPLGAMLVLGKPGAKLAESERDLWESVGGTVSAALHAADDFEHVVALEAEKRQLVDNLPVIVARLDPKTGATLFVNGAVERVLGFSTVEVQGQPGLDGLLADPIEWEASAVARDRAARGHESTLAGPPLASTRTAASSRSARKRLSRPRSDRNRPCDPGHRLRRLDRDRLAKATHASRSARVARLPRRGDRPRDQQPGRLHRARREPAREDARAGAARPMDATERERAKQLLVEVNEAAARIANIVGELKLFTRIPEGAHVTPVDVNRIVQMALTLTSAELRRGARVEMNLGELPLVPGEYTSLGQAFVNLLLNAAQAVHAKNDAGATSCFVRVSTFVSGAAIVVRVSDTGVGIEPRLLPRIFDPFFKTKDSGEGAGLGLAIAHNLVRRVGGDIRVTSEPGEGSTFDVILPLDPAARLPSARLSPGSATMRAASDRPLRHRAGVSSSSTTSNRSPRPSRGSSRTGGRSTRCRPRATRSPSCRCTGTTSSRATCGCPTSPAPRSTRRSAPGRRGRRRASSSRQAGATAWSTTRSTRARRRRGARSSRNPSTEGRSMRSSRRWRGRGRLSSRDRPLIGTGTAWHGRSRRSRGDRARSRRARRRPRRAR